MLVDGGASSCAADATSCVEAERVVESLGPSTQTDTPKGKKARNLLDLRPVSEDEVKKVMEAIELAKVKAEQAQNSWRPVPGDMVKKKDGGRCAEDTWTLESGELATIVESHRDGSFKLRNPRGGVSEAFFAKDNFAFVRKDKAVQDKLDIMKMRAIEEAWAEKGRMPLTGKTKPGRDQALRQACVHDLRFEEQPKFVQDAVLATSAHDLAFAPDSYVVQLALRSKAAREAGLPEPVAEEILSKKTVTDKDRPAFPTHKGEFVWAKKYEAQAILRGENKKDKADNIKEDNDKKEEKSKKAKKDKKDKKEKKAKSPKLSKDEKKLKKAQEDLRRAEKILQKLHR